MATIAADGRSQCYDEVTTMVPPWGKVEPVVIAHKMPLSDLNGLKTVYNIQPEGDLIQSAERYEPDHETITPSYMLIKDDGGFKAPRNFMELMVSYDIQPKGDAAQSVESYMPADATLMPNYMFSEEVGGFMTLKEIDKTTFAAQVMSQGNKTVKAKSQQIQDWNYQDSPSLVEFSESPDADWRTTTKKMKDEYAIPEQHVEKQVLVWQELRVLEFTFQQVAISRTRKRLKAMVKVSYDPAAKEWLQGHCLFACLTWAMWGKDSHPHIMALRHLAAEGLREDTQLLHEAGLQEKLAPDDYIRQYTIGGWGGIPELEAISKKQGYTFRVWDQHLKLLYVAENGSKCVDLLYSAEHYRLLSLKQLTIGRGHNHPRSGLRGGAGEDARSSVILKTREQCRQERRERREREQQQPPQRQVPLPPLDRPKRKLDSTKEVKDEQAPRPSGSNRPVSPALKPRKAARVESLSQPIVEPKTDNQELKTKMQDHEAYEIIVEKERFCCLCGKWSDPPHRSSGLHRKRVAHVEEMDVEEKKEYMESAKQWAKKAAQQRLRGGAGSEEDKATKTEQPNPENQNVASSASSSTQQETSLATLIDTHDAGEESISCDLAHLSLIAQVQADSETESHVVQGAPGNEEPLREDHESDFGRESVTESFASDLSFLDQPPEEARCMKIVIGRRLIMVCTCQHTSTMELMAHLAISARLHTDSVALVRGNEMITSHSQIGLYLPLNGAAWKLWKLPLSRERRQAQLETESKTPDECMDERCDSCKSADADVVQASAQSSNEEPIIAPAEENELMQAEDGDVILIKLRRSRDTILWTARRGVSVEDVLRHYAMVKRVRKSGLIAYEAMSPAQQFNADAELLLQTGQPPLRGGLGTMDPAECIFKVTDFLQNIVYELFVPETVAELRAAYGGGDTTIMCQGMVLPDELYLTNLQWRELQILPARSSMWPQLSASSDGLLSGPCSLGDLCQWMMPHRRHLKLSEQLWQIWLQDTLVHCTGRDSCALRGGGPGRPPWESTATLKGVKVINHIKVESKTIQPITVDLLCDNATGVACCLMSSWSRISQLQSSEPLLIIFPGKCMGTLRRLGAAENKVSEGELFMQDGEESSIFKRKVTFYKISEHTFDIGSNIRNVKWQPAAQTEIIIELDGRWATQTTVERAKADWKSVALAACKAATMTALQSSEIYGVRNVDMQPFDLWQARVRIDAEATEKLLGASGKDAIFFRPASPNQLQSASQFTIVWAKKGAEANSTALAATLQMLTQIAGHRGLARSISALGARVPWTAIREARTLFTPEDKRFVPETLSIKDSSKYKLDGVPAGATAQELARYLREVEWAAIPQRRLPGKLNAVWLVSAESAPKDCCLRWGESNILVSAIADDDKVLQRQPEKMNKKSNRKIEEFSKQDENEKAQQFDDKLHEKDPWAKWMRSAGSSASQSSSSKEMRVVPPSAQIFDMIGDSRLAVLANRMDKMESDHHKLATEVKTMDGKLGTLQTDMAHQFQQVLQGLASIQEMQADSAKKHKAAGS